MESFVSLQSTDFITDSQDSELTWTENNALAYSSSGQANEDSELTRTENNALAYSSSGQANVNLFTMLVRGVEQDKVDLWMEKAWEENPEMAVKVVFLNRDIRGGKGERACSYQALIWMRRNKPKTYAGNIYKITSDYGCYVDLLKIGRMSKLDKQKLLGKELLELELLAKQLKKDKLLLGEGKKEISLAAKWAPTERCHFDKKGGYARRIAKLMYPEEKLALSKYRKEILVPLRAHLKVVERDMCSGRWETINYSQVPSVATKNYRNAFKKHDAERYETFLEDVREGKAKINSGAVQPHQLVKHYLGGGSLDATIEAQWKTQVETLRAGGGFSGILPVVDVSGSMSGEPMEVAISLGLLCSLVSPPESSWHRKMISFSAKPQLFSVEGDTLEEMVRSVQGMDWGMNTDFVAVFKLILEMKQDDPDCPVPAMVVCFTDMQFDDSCPSSLETVYSSIEMMFKKAELVTPKFVFWNLRASNEAFPVRSDTPNTALVSGFSQILLKVFMECQEEFTPQAVLKQMLDKYQVFVDPAEVSPEEEMHRQPQEANEQNIDEDEWED